MVTVVNEIKGKEILYQDYNLTLNCERIIGESLKGKPLSECNPKIWTISHYPKFDGKKCEFCSDNLLFLTGSSYTSDIPDQSSDSIDLVCSNEFCSIVFYLRRYG